MEVMIKRKNFGRAANRIAVFQSLVGSLICCVVISFLHAFEEFKEGNCVLNPEHLVLQFRKFSYQLNIVLPNTTHMLSHLSHMKQISSQYFIISFN